MKIFSIKMYFFVADQVEDPINTPRLKLLTKVDETQSRWEENDKI